MMVKVTTVEQSKELAKILPIESADLWWSRRFIYYQPTAMIGISVEPTQLYTFSWGDDDIPGWSAEAIISQFPTVINNSCNLRIIPYSNGDFEIGYEDPEGNMYLSQAGESLVEAAFKLTLDLKTYGILS